MENVARVVLGLEEHDVAEEVMHFLDRSGVARVVATAADDRQLLEAVRQLEPDAVVAQPALVTAGVVRARAVLALDTRESVASLRAAIRAGARGYYLWPGERAALADAAASTVARTDQLLRRATVVAVHAPRGGAGCTFVATHLAAAFARRGDCVLVDADPDYGDVTPAIGAPVDEAHTAADLVPLLDELNAERVGEALWEHPSGFRALLAPTGEATETVDASARPGSSAPSLRSPTPSWCTFRADSSPRSRRWHRSRIACWRCSRSTCCRSVRGSARSRRSRAQVSRPDRSGWS